MTTTLVLDSSVAKRNYGFAAKSAALTAAKQVNRRQEPMQHGRGMNVERQRLMKDISQWLPTSRSPHKSRPKLVPEDDLNRKKLLKDISTMQVPKVNVAHHRRLSRDDSDQQRQSLLREISEAHVSKSKRRKSKGKKERTTETRGRKERSELKLKKEQPPPENRRALLLDTKGQAQNRSKDELDMMLQEEVEAREEYRKAFWKRRNRSASPKPERRRMGAQPTNERCGVIQEEPPPARFRGRRRASVDHVGGGGGGAEDISGTFDKKAPPRNRRMSLEHSPKPPVQLDRRGRGRSMEHGLTASSGSDASEQDRALRSPEGRRRRKSGSPGAVDKPRTSDSSMNSTRSTSPPNNVGKTADFRKNAMKRVSNGGVVVGTTSRSPPKEDRPHQPSHEKSRKERSKDELDLMLRQPDTKERIKQAAQQRKASRKSPKPVKDHKSDGIMKPKEQHPRQTQIQSALPWLCMD